MNWCTRVIALALCAGPLSLHAQNRQQASDSAQRLPEVSITATRTDQSILRLPLAVTRVPKADLRATAGFGLDEALRTTPGVLAQSRYGTSDVRITIRGFGARGAGDRSNAGTSRGIRVLIDGIPETEPDGRTSFDQIDLAAAEGVDIIRSNASAVWGNAAGGVVNVLTLPPAGDRGVEFETQMGGMGLARYIARMRTPVGQGIAYGNFVNTNFDGWRAHSSARRALVNLGIVGPIGDRTRIGVFASAANNLSHIPGPLTQAEVDADPMAANASYASRDERRYNRVGRLAVTLDHDLDSAITLSTMAYVNPKYLQRSERGTFRDFNRYHVGGNVTARARWTLSPSVGSTLLVGADEAYQDGAILFYGLSATNGRGTDLRDNKGEGANNVGVFAQEELLIGARLSLTLGARYDNASYYYRSYINPALNASKSFRRLTPKLGASWLLDGLHSIYANVGGGIEVPAGNETDPAPPLDATTAINPLLEPIRSTTYELGLKSLGTPVAGSALRLVYDVALYNTEVSNEIIPYRGGRFYFTAGKARRSGAELGLGVETSVGLSVMSSLTLSRNRYVQYVVDSSYYSAALAGRTADYSDNKIVGVPSTFANGEVGYTLPIKMPLRLTAGAQYVGEYFADDANSVHVPAYTLLNVGAQLPRELTLGSGVTLRGFVRVNNVTDRQHIGSAFLNPDVVNGQPVAFEPGMPRTVVVSFTVGRR